MNNNGPGKNRNKDNLDGDVPKDTKETVRIDAQSEDIGSTFNLEEWCFSEEFDSISAHIPSLAEAVSPPSRTAEEAKTISSVDSNDSTILLQTVNSRFPDISLDKSHDDIKVSSPINCILSDHEVDGTVLETTSNSTSHKTVAKESTGSSSKLSLSSSEFSKCKIDCNFEQSSIQVSSQLGSINTNNASMQQALHGVLETFTSNYGKLDVSNLDKLDNGCELTKTQLNRKSSDEICDSSSICKILSISSMTLKNNEDTAPTKSRPHKSDDLQLKKNETSPLKTDVPVIEEHAVYLDDFIIKTKHAKSLECPKEDQANKCISYSELNETTPQPTVETLKESSDFDLVDIDALLLEPLIQDNMLEEFIDVEVVPIETDHSTGETKEKNSKFHQDENNVQGIKDDESFQNSSEFSPSKPIQSTNILSDNYYSSRKYLIEKSKLRSLNISIHLRRLQKLKKYTKAKKKKTKLFKNVLKIAGTTHSSSMSRWSPKTLSSIVKDYPTVNSNLTYIEDLDLKKRQILDKISKIKNLTLSNILEHLTEDDITTLGGEILEDEQPLGFARGLEPETIVGMHVEEETCFFIIKWIGSNQADLVTAEEAKVCCPQLVIAFYEKQYISKFLPQEVGDFL